MTNIIKNRVLTFANFILSTHSTIRKTANHFGYSKSTVHHDVSVKLRKINTAMYDKISVILSENFKEKHLRGGLATKLKYKKII